MQPRPFEEWIEKGHRRAATILQSDLFYTRISNFVQSPILSATRLGLKHTNSSLLLHAPDCRVEVCLSRGRCAVAPCTISVLNFLKNIGIW